MCLVFIKMYIHVGGVHLLLLRISFYFVKGFCLVSRHLFFFLLFSNQPNCLPNFFFKLVPF